ncbi:MAG: DUF4416 family protein [Chloroflexi bacterium]|nr:DUF4416 family protein [Chloroflexota bacterium]
MGRIREALPVKLIVPMLSASPALLSEASAALSARFGPVDYASAHLPSTYTEYYTEEMGPGLQRYFVSFGPLIDAGALAEIKLTTNALEQEWSERGKRRVNLDPGYLAPGKLVLATTKDHAHRVYLGRGIYAEVTLAYRDGAFAPWQWTYPDYCSAGYHAILREIRTLYMEQLRAQPRL